MQTNDIRLIVMDMDGTLLNSAGQVSPGNREALQSARDAGIHLAIGSGRSPGDIAAFAVENGLNDCALLSLNGGYCQLTPNAPAFANHTFSDETVELLQSLLRPTQTTYGFFAQNAVAVFENGATVNENLWFSHMEGPYAPVLLRGEDGFQSMRLTCHGVNKLMCAASTQQAMDEVLHRLQPLDDLDLFMSWPLNLEIMPKGIGKGLAVRELAEHLGLSASQVMALGDYDNDLSMMEYAGWSVAMGNACETLRLAARYSTLSNDEDGVAYAIRQYALKNAD